MKEEANDFGFGDDSHERLLVRIAQEDETAMTEFYESTKARVFGICLRILKAVDLAEEAALEVYTKIWTQAHRYRSRKGVARVWINTLTRNTCLDFLRKESRRTRLNQEPCYIEFNSVPASQEAALFNAQLAQSIKQSMKALTDAQKVVINAAYFEGLSHSQIAKAYNLPLGSVKTRIRTALEVLRRELGPALGAP